MHTAPLISLPRNGRADQVNLPRILPVPLTPGPEAQARARPDDFFPNDFYVDATFRCVEN